MISNLWLNLLSLCTLSCCGFWWTRFSADMRGRETNVSRWPWRQRDWLFPPSTLASVVYCRTAFAHFVMQHTVCVFNVKWLNEKVVLQWLVCCGDELKSLSSTAMALYDRIKGTQINVTEQNAVRDAHMSPHLQQVKIWKRWEVEMREWLKLPNVKSLVHLHPSKNVSECVLYMKMKDSYTS